MTKLYCPFDNMELIFQYDHMEKWFKCSNCTEIYSLYKGKTQEEIINQAKNKVKNYQTRLEKIESEKKDIINKLKIAKKAGLIKDNKTDLSSIVLTHKNSKAIKEMNKANLSAKELRSHPMDDANFMMDGHY